MRLVLKLYNRIFYAYYYFLIIVSSGNGDFLRYLARVCPYEKLRRSIWTKIGMQVGEGAYINHSIILLDGSHKPDVIIGDRVSLSPGITFITHSSPNNSILASAGYAKHFSKIAPIEIGEDSWIGAGVVIHPGVKVGARSIVGSMSNVTKDIPSDCLCYGNPAKVIRKLK